MVVTYKWPALALPLMLIVYVYLFAVIIDVAVMWHKLKKKLIEKFGEQSVAKGMRSGSYAWSRAIQIRRWRLPKPRYPKRGHWPGDRYREPPVIFRRQRTTDGFSITMENDCSHRTKAHFTCVQTNQ